MSVTLGSQVGELVNTATGDIQITGSGPGGLFVEQAEVVGQVRNEGSISVTATPAPAGANATGGAGINAESATLTGGVLNSGTITGLAQGSLPVSGVRLNNSTSGEIMNSGSIDLTGAESRGLSVQESEINGSVTNSGDISAQGNGSRGILAFLSELAGSLLNTGTISVDGAGTSALALSSSSATEVGNTGTITSTGANSQGMVVVGQSAVSGDVFNEGAITQDGTSGYGVLVGSIGAPVQVQVSGDVRNDGSIVGSSSDLNSRSGGILIVNAGVGGQAVNSGMISAESAGRLDGISVVNGSEVGALINDSAGTIDLEATNVAALSVESSEVAGAVSNQGSVAVSSIANSGADGTAAGISLVDAIVLGSVTNSGSIQAQAASGANARAITLQGATASDILNTGTIRAQGGGSVGLNLAESTISGEIGNQGTISAEGVDSVGVRIEDGSVARFNNSGSVRGGRTGFQLGGALNTLNNSGTVLGGTHGVVVSGPGTLLINHSAGLISGGTAAILGGGNTQLNWSAGSVDGDLRGLAATRVTGPTLFQGSLIESAEVEIAGANGGATGGVLTFDQLHSEIDGNLRVNGGGAIGLSIDPLLTETGRAVLNVTGSAEFMQGSQVRLAARSEDFSLAGSEYRLVSAGSLNDQGLSIASSSALLVVDRVANANGVEVRVTRKNDDRIADAVSGRGGSGNAVNAVQPLANSVLGQLNESDPVFQAFANASEEELVKLAEQLAPEVNGASVQGALGGLKTTAGVVNTRATGGKTGVSAGDAFTSRGMWIQALGTDGNQDIRDGVEGFDSRSDGMLLGFDATTESATTLGVAYSVFDTRVTSDGGDKAEIESQALTLYGARNWGSFNLNGSVTYGQNDNEADRLVAGTIAEGDYDSSLLGVELTASYMHALGGSSVLEPIVGARYSRVDIDGYRETGSAAALAVQDQRLEVGELGAGARLAASFITGKGVLSPEVRAMAYHDLIADSVSTRSSYVLGGAPFASFGADPARNTVEVGASVTYQQGAFGVSVGYDHLEKEDFDQGMLWSRLRYDF